MKTRSDTFQFEKELDWKKPAPGIRRQMMGYDGQLMMVKVEFEEGAVGAVHQHYHSQATYVASGKFELTIGDRKEILSTGDGYYVEPDQPHGCVCLEAGVRLSISTQSGIAKLPISFFNPLKSKPVFPPTDASI